MCALCECVCVPLESNVMHTVDTQTSRGRCGASLLPLSTIGHPRKLRTEFALCVRPLIYTRFPIEFSLACTPLRYSSSHFCFPLRSLPPSLLGAARAFRFRACSVAKTMQIRRAQDARAPQVPRPCHDHSSSPRPPPILHSRKYGTRLLKPGLTTGNVAAHA